MQESQSLARLIQILSPRPLDEEQTFTADNIQTGGNRLYGGQVLGQVLAAAVATVPEDRLVHSQHAYFLRAGSTDLPVILEVEIARDGGSFSSRRVVAKQADKVILVSSLSFQKPEEGVEYYPTMPEVPAPEELISERQRDLAADEPNTDFVIVTGTDLDVRVEEPWDLRNPEPRTPPFYVWMKTTDVIGDTPGLHQALLAYMSDAYLIDACLLIHGSQYKSSAQISSLDHAMWFHAPMRADEWLLFEMRGERVGGARGLSTSRVYNRAGVLVASCAQEGLLRVG